jgi:amidohydrolase
MHLSDEVKRLAGQYFPEIVAIRQHLHKNPELSFRETGTSAFIQEQLDKLGIRYRTGYVKTGIVGWIEGKNPLQKMVALRADMDALPVLEQNDIPFRSQNNGVMHACGHDMHIAALLGAARILVQLREEIEGTVMLIFQPAEEKLPGGAKLMIQEGIFEDRIPDLIIGQHVMPNLESGRVGYRPGMYMASSDEIYLTVRGKGGHGAMPQQLVDPVLIAAHILIALQQIVSRNADPSIPSVLSFGKVEAMGATNVIPTEVKLEGTFRTMNENWRKEAHKRLTAVAESVAGGMGGSCEVNILNGYPVLSNHTEKTLRAAEFSRQLLGNDQVKDLDMRMTSEDFAYFSEIVPAVFYRFGTTDPENSYISPLHSATYMADERSLITAMGNMAWLALSFLREL